MSEVPKARVARGARPRPRAARTSPRTLLPDRPLGFRAGHHVRVVMSLLVLLTVAAVPAGFGVWAVSDVVDLHREERIWETGVLALDGELEGKTHSGHFLGWLMKDYDLVVRYRDLAGVAHEGAMSFTTMLGNPDTDEEPEVRHDPAHPERFALSWAIEAGGARWRKAILAGVFFGVLSFGVLTLAWLFGRRAFARRRVGRDGDELIARVLDVRVVHDSNGAPTSRRAYQLLLPPPAGIEVGPDDDANRTMWSDDIDVLEHPPFFADRDDSTVSVLYLRAAEPQLIVLCDGFYPLALTAAEKAEGKRRAEARREASFAHA